MRHGLLWVLPILLLTACDAQSGDVASETLQLDDSQYTLEQVLERHRTALGGEALAALETVTKRGSITAPDYADAPVTTMIRDDAGYLRRIERPAGDIVLAWDGTTAWQRGARTDRTGVITLDREQSLLYAVLADIEGPLLSAAEEGWKVEHLGATAEGEEVVQVTVPELGPRLYFLDPETFLLTQVVDYRDAPRPDEPEMMVVTRYARYRAVDGVQMPFFETTKIGDLGFEQSITWDSITTGEELGAELFAVPAE